MSALRFANITVERGGRRILDRVSGSFAGGKLTAVIGPNGAGKSTLLQVAAGLLKPGTGSLHFGDLDLARLSRAAMARKRAYLPQRAAVDWPISVERVVGLGLLPQLPAFGGLPATLQPAIAQALEECDIAHLRDRQATSLSGGELARVMLARAIVSDPELLIIDEPTSDLDPRHGIDAARRLRARADAGRTVVMAIHDLGMALRFSDEIVAIRDGALVAAGPTETAMTEAMLADLYQVRVRIVRDADGAAIRFLD
ncbi:ABC transporter ATP-binding protein [Sphingomonas sp. MMS12-HWE2-04]|uniref:ABC transporter ATP-binding protein n=1 Tax=Sphingomonas sp. MMS12-HWE2-04 TaxID=3234199 RepID=UPI00384BD834